MPSQQPIRKIAKKKKPKTLKVQLFHTAIDQGDGNSKVFFFKSKKEMNKRIVEKIAEDGYHTGEEGCLKLEIDPKTGEILSGI